jgi:DNA-binding transcriptional ArsR family regulator
MHMHDQLPDFDMPDSEQVDLAAETFRLLADPTRIKILWALLQGESSVACLADIAGTSPTAVSQHLAKLRMSRLVTARRQGTFIYYSAADDHVRKLLAQALHHADHIDPASPEDAQPAHAGLTPVKRSS